MNYEKLMSHNPTILGELTNTLKQKIIFVEHPLQGDSYPVIAVCHELKLAASTEFFDLDDMLADHKEYEPGFVNGELLCGDLAFYIEDYLCVCNNCDTTLIDQNPQVDAQKRMVHVRNAIHMKQFKDGSEFFWGCPNCGTDDYLSDTVTN